LFPKLVILDGSVIEFKLLQLNANSAGKEEILLPSKVIVVKLVQLVKQLAPILLTTLPIVTLTKVLAKLRLLANKVVADDVLVVESL
jgi:hypothetical protein